MIELGLLKSLDIRDVWRLEPQHFSAWLAANLAALSTAIGIELELRRQEMSVGAFSLDILAHDTYRDRVVIIENQLTRTDHDHLGKLITYAAGLKASVLIWISPQFREEHRAAIDWLNENTDDTKEFFGIQIEALQIDDSRPAANFKLVSSPNDWQKVTSATAHGPEDTGRRAFFLEYFSDLGSAARKAGFARAQTSTGHHDLVLDRLPGGASIAAAFSRGLLTLGLYIGRNDAAENRRIFEALRSDEEEIRTAVSADLTWDFNEQRVRQQVWTSTAVDRNSATQLEVSRNWAIDMARRFKDVFEPRILSVTQGDRLAGITGPADSLVP